MGRPAEYAHEYEIEARVAQLSDLHFKKTKWADSPNQGQRFAIRDIKRTVKREHGLERPYVVIESCRELR